MIDWQFNLELQQRKRTLLSVKSGFDLLKLNIHQFNSVKQMIQQLYLQTITVKITKTNTANLIQLYSLHLYIFGQDIKCYFSASSRSHPVCLFTGAM